MKKLHSYSLELLNVLEYTSCSKRPHTALFLDLFLLFVVYLGLHLFSSIGVGVFLPFSVVPDLYSCGKEVDSF